MLQSLEAEALPEPQYQRFAQFTVNQQEEMAWATAEEDMACATTEVPDSVESEADF